MAPSSGFLLPWYAALAGLGLSILLEQCKQPRPPLHRPVAAWAVHIGVWLVLHGVLTALLGRPWFAMAAGL
ncbi:hypothetical protein, partial [Escherichia coli]|uniref:hypothetical protein n=1 Tax=Escherichia coli TaxID=562 RepID=UPI00215AE340